MTAPFWSWWIVRAQVGSTHLTPQLTAYATSADDALAHVRETCLAPLNDLLPHDRQITANTAERMPL